jgi:HK97 family phage major capsid protein
VNLSPLKVAALAVVSNELLRDSSPSAEMLVRDGLVESTAQRIDLTVFSTTAESAGVSPPGLLNGVVALGSNGITAADVLLDVQELKTEFITNLMTSGLYWVMNPALAMRLSLMRSTLGVREFPDINGGTFEGLPVVTGDNIGAAHLILVRPSDVYSIGDQGIQVSISRDAMIEMATNPGMESEGPTSPTQKYVGMFQTESTAIKIVRPINFAKRRPEAVQFMEDVFYGVSGGTTT